MAILRLEPAGMAIVPDATPPAIGILKIKAVGMSAAVTSATKVATAEADTSALTMSGAWPGPGPPEVAQVIRSARRRVRGRACAGEGSLERSTSRGLSGLRSRS